MADDKPIIVVKKKGGHGGHHGGAWKIAYADFVTAMMAFFMVMWLVNSASVTTRQSIASYFRKPGIFTEGSGTPLMLGGAGILEDAFVPPRPEDKKKKAKSTTQNPQQKLSGESDRDLDKRYQEEGRAEPQRGKGPNEVLGLNSNQKQLEEVKREIKIRQAAQEAEMRIQSILKQMPEINKLLGKIDVKVEADGLKIEIMDTDKTSMFDSGSPRIRKEAEAAFAKVTEVIKKYPNNLEISGHTDATPFPSRSGGYTNWELSADRANAARRLVEAQGFSPKQIISVIGKSSTEPKLPEAPNAASNRRITLKMKIDVDTLLPETGGGDGSSPLDDLLSPPPGQAAVSVSTPEAGGTPLSTPTPTPTQTPTPAPTQARSRTMAAEAKDRVKLPDGPPITANPDFMPDDKIFNNSPVLGPAELYSGR